MRVTSRSALEAVTGGEGFTAQDRGFAAYADPADADALTRRFEALFSRQGNLRWVASDYTAGSAWANQRAAVPLLLNTFLGGFLALGAGFLRRRRAQYGGRGGCSCAVESWPCFARRRVHGPAAADAGSGGGLLRGGGVLFGLPLGAAFLALIGRMLWTGLFDALSPLPVLSATLGAALVSGLALAVSLRSLDRLPLAEALSCGE